MHRAGGFMNRAVAQFDQVWMEWDRFDLPDAAPGYVHLLFTGETFAGCFGLIEHREEFSGIDMALVKGDVAFAHYGGDDTRFGDHTANRADTVVPFGDLTGFQRYFGRGTQRVAALVHRRRTGV